MTIKAIIREKGSPIIGIIAVLINPKFIQNSPIRYGKIDRVSISNLAKIIPYLAASVSLPVFLSSSMSLALLIAIITEHNNPDWMPSRIAWEFSSPEKT